MTLEIGARVRLKRSHAEWFTQPWRGRFEKGRQGTIIQGPSANINGWLVEWDHRHVRHVHEWQIDHRPNELELIEQEPDDDTT